MHMYWVARKWRCICGSDSTSNRRVNIPWLIRPMDVRDQLTMSHRYYNFQLQLLNANSNETLIFCTVDKFPFYQGRKYNTLTTIPNENVSPSGISRVGQPNQHVASATASCVVMVVSSASSSRNGCRIGRFWRLSRVQTRQEVSNRFEYDGLNTRTIDMVYRKQEVSQHDSEILDEMVKEM